MAWTEFPLDGGACNDKDPFALKQGEFSEASGVAYKPDSKQLYNDLAYVAWNYRPSEIGSGFSGWKGPFYLSFEGKHDWIMLVVTKATGVEETTTYRGEIYFARADGTGTGWVKSSYTLTDNIGNQSTITAASIAHWGDRYYLATDMGCAEIAPPTGTGPPQVVQLGLLMPEGSGVLGRNYVFAATWSWLSTSSDSDLVVDDIVTVYITEYDTDSDIESAPSHVYQDTSPPYETYQTVGVNGEYIQVGFPGAALNSGNGKNIKFRAYLKYYGNTTSGLTIASVISQQAATKFYKGATTGLSLLYDPDTGDTEFDAAETVSFTAINKSAITNSLPVVALDNARLIFQPQRQPNTSTIATVWNDSLILGDTGFDNGTAAYRDADKVPTILRYSPPGEPWNQPVPYFLNFASEREDAIRAVKVVNDRLLVLCDSAVHSVRYLPFNNLLASQQGRVKDVVTTNIGLASPAAVVKVETGRGEMCVWLSNRGLEWSDGSAWDDACPDFAVPDGDDATTGVLVNLPKEYRIDLYLGTKLYSFYYHPSHMKGGRLKMLGPTELNARIYGACEYKGTVYRFDGVDIEWTSADGDPADAYVYTGHIHGSNPFKDLSIKDLGLAHGPVNGDVKLQCDAAVTGHELQVGNQVTIPNPELEEVGAAGIAQRGTYVRFRLDVDAAGDWAVGPMWVSGGEESGGNG